MDSNMAWKIDPETRDLVFDDEGNVEMLYGDETTAQAVRLTLQAWKKEWPFDLAHGTDYKRITKKNHELEPGEPEEVIREAIMQEDDVVQVDEVTVTRAEKHGLEVGFHGTLASGKKISTEVVV